MTYIIILISVLATPLFGRDLPKPELMLANTYHEGIDLENYWVSEKYDGVRALWNGENLVSRGGNIYHAPKWFTAGFPQQALDGELWISRQSFELLVSTVRVQVPDDSAWEKVNYMVFDMPDLDVSFDERLKHLKKLIHTRNIKWLKAVQHWKIENHQSLMKNLNEVVDAGAEGLMLHRGLSFYKGKRNSDLLKLKMYQDAEAVVVGHIKGKGKFTGMLGALIVETPNGIRFKIGTGFSNEERQNAPELGQIVTYQYRGKTKNNVPRFASYLRIKVKD